MKLRERIENRAKSGKRAERATARATLKTADVAAVAAGTTVLGTGLLATMATRIIESGAYGALGLVETACRKLRERHERKDADQPRVNKVRKAARK